MRTIRGSDTVSEAILTILIHLRKVEKYSNSNGCMSIYDTSSYSWADMMFTVLLFCSKFDLSICQKDTMMTIRGSNRRSDALPTILIHQREVRKHSSSNRCMPFLFSLVFPGVIWCPPQLVILLEV